MNISSRSTDPLLAALTNPTELAVRKGKLPRSHPVIDKTGKRWTDSEAAYKAFKTGNTPRDERVMVRIIRAKLEEYPCLIDEIKKRGGVAFLERCNHFVGVKNSRWEGQGLDSRFIRCLITAFEAALEKTGR